MEENRTMKELKTKHRAGMLLPGRAEVGLAGLCLGEDKGEGRVRST